MSKISACLVVHNEEKVIRRCLNSLKDVVAEIIIIHDGECGDNTLLICREFTDKIFIREYAGVAEPHRPFSFEQASGDWILQIDADEFLSVELKAGLRDLADGANYEAYDFLWKLWDGEKYITKNWPHKRCLFKKSKLSYLGVPNFVPKINGEVMKSDLIMEHKPYYNNYTLGSFRQKWVKWAKLQAAVYKKDFLQIEKFNYRADDWPKKINLRKKFPLFLSPFECLLTAAKNLSSGGIREGLAGFKVSLMVGMYRAAVNYYLSKK